MKIRTQKITQQTLNNLTLQQKIDIVTKIAQAKKVNPEYLNAFDQYVPTVPALYFHRSMADVIEFSGGNAAAKTYTSTVHYSSYLLGRPPKTMEHTWCRPLPHKPVVWRLNGINNDAINMYLFPAFEKILPPGTILHKNKESHIIEVKSIWSDNEPSVLQFKTYEMDIDAHAGATLDGIGFDEQPLKEELYHESIKRMRMAKPFCISFCMTAEKGKTWLFDIIDEKARTIYLSVPNKAPVKRLPEYAISDEFTRERHMEIQNIESNFANNPSVEVINATVYDNPYVSDDFIIKFYNTLKDYPEKLDINMLGKTVSLTGLVIPEYNRQHHWVQNSGIILDPSYPRFIAIDDHTDFFAVTMLCMTPPTLSSDKRGVAYVERDIRCTGRLDDICKEIRLMEDEEVEWNGSKQKRWIVWRIVDPRVGMKDIRTGRTILQDMKDSYKVCDLCGKPMTVSKAVAYCKKCNRTQKGMIVRPANKDKERGIMLVRNAFRFDDEEKVNSHLYVCEEAKNTDYELRHWVYKDNKPQDKDDHWMSNLERLFQQDGCRYMEKHEYSRKLSVKEYAICP